MTIKTVKNVTIKTVKNMTQTAAIDAIISSERENPTFSAHHINSYVTNLPVGNANTELKSILKYFPDHRVYLSLFQKDEFKNGLSIEVKAEMINNRDTSAGITYMESLYHNHDFFEMMYVYKGHCTNFINNTEMRLQEGDLLLYNLQTVHKLIIDNAETVVFNILVGREIFSQSFMELLQNDDPVMQFFINSLYSIPDDQYISFHLTDEDALQPLLDLIIEFARKDLMYTSIMRSDYMNLIIRLARMRRKNQTLKSSSSSSMDINNVLRYIHDHFKNISLVDLADHYGYTPRSMIRYLKKYTHMTFSEILRNYRLLIACDRLRICSLSIDEIARETGFSERGYFDRVFKQYFSVTPAEYRTKYKIEE